MGELIIKMVESENTICGITGKPEEK